jgi:oxygen-dependent protoporphyrinogen oxidase
LCGSFFAVYSSALALFLLTQDLPVFDLLSIVGKLRAGLGALGLKPAAPGPEESVEAFVRRNLARAHTLAFTFFVLIKAFAFLFSIANQGDEVFERLIEPFCSGVYAVRGS